MRITVALQVFKVVAPLVLELVAKHQRATGDLPTEAELISMFNANIEAGLAEGDAWLRDHPRRD